METNLDLELPALVEISDRGEAEMRSDRECFPNSVVIAKAQDHKVQFSLALNEEEEEVQLSMRTFHVEDEETGKGFHVIIDTLITAEQLRCLRRYIDFLCAV